MPTPNAGELITSALRVSILLAATFANDVVGGVHDDDFYPYNKFSDMQMANIINKLCNGTQRNTRIRSSLFSPS